MATQPKPAFNVVPINVFRDGTAHPDRAGPLSKQNADEAKFCSQDDVDVIFDMDGCPFVQGPTFPVKAGKCTPSGPLKGDAVAKDYHYHVKPSHGMGPGADPTIIVTN